VTQVAHTLSRVADERLAAMHPMVVMPALNEEACIARVIEEVRRFEPAFEVVVVDDGSSDRTAELAAALGANVLPLPFNLGIGAAVQTGYKFAADRGSRLVVQVDGDGQHDPRQVSLIVEPILKDEADIVIGSRFAGTGGYRSPLSRRVGIRLFAGLVSALIGQRLTDTSSSFRALNRRSLVFFASIYPHGYLETVEATVLAARHGLRVKEVPVTMRERLHGRSALTTPLSIFYGFKVLVAVFVGLFRRTTIPSEEDV
jgi:glycosyltransferase involved in cell wall biosynthesis